jgi:hypothetical protein
MKKGGGTAPSIQMDHKFQATLRSFVPFLVFTFFICGVSGLFCPMPASATDTSHSQSASHHSSSSQTTGECPEQLTTAAGIFEKNDVGVGVVSVAAVTWLHDILSFDLFKFLGIERTPHSTTYPLLFLLFSVFLN